MEIAARQGSAAWVVGQFESSGNRALWLMNPKTAATRWEMAIVDAVSRNL
jgi:hypothetical protein